MKPDAWRRFIQGKWHYFDGEELYARDAVANEWDACYSAATIRKWLEKAPEEFNTHHKETYAVLIALKLEELK